MPGRLGFGSLVVCAGPDPPAAGAKDGVEVGIVAELRKADCRVQYCPSGRSVWVPLSGVRLARQEESNGTLVGTVAQILELLAAREVEFSVSGVGGLTGGGRFRLVASHGAIVPETVDRVRSLLGSRLGQYVIRPEGMHRVQTVLDFSHDCGGVSGC